MSAYSSRVFHLRPFSSKRTPVYPLTRSLHHSVNNGKRIEGENNMKKNHDTRSVARSESNTKCQTKPPIDPKSKPDDYAPYEETSGDHNQSGMHTAEYRNVDKQGEPYSPPGGEHRYGGTKGPREEH